MKKFKFRLQKVLDLREKIEHEKKRVLSEKNARLREAEAMLDELFQARAGIEFYHTTADILMSGMFLAGLLKRIELQKEQVGVCEKDAEEAQVEFHNAAMEAEVLRKLKEKKEREHTEFIEKTEAAFIDELATLGFSRKR